MASLNKVLLIGNLGSDPEIRTLPSGGKVASFSIATTESYKNKEGEKVECTEWHRIELWEGLAAIAEQYLKKGDTVYVEGKLKTEKYTDANGLDKTAIKIRGNNFQMLGRRNVPNTINETHKIESEDGLPF
ncbi:MAG: single-stranded DNA-binding protein [Spirosomataceae bacterium]|jgi:single-strand DNA-binding protein